VNFQIREDDWQLDENLKSRPQSSDSDGVAALLFQSHISANESKIASNEEIRLGNRSDTAQRGD
jgi:hypothetical protein